MTVAMAHIARTSLVQKAGGSGRQHHQAHRKSVPSAWNPTD